MTRKFVQVLLVCVCAFAVFPALAAAETFEVDTLEDATHFEGCVYISECSLRDAIERANEFEGGDTIEFAVTGTIELEFEPLPAIQDQTTIDATTAPGYAGEPLVAIDGSDAFTEGATTGLFVSSGGGNSRIEGLAIGGFDIGVELAGSSSSYLCTSYIGVGLDGETAFANGNGVETGFHAPGNRIGSECGNGGGNLISGNSAYGIVDFGTGTDIANNRIGLDAFAEPLGNGGPSSIAAGVLVSQFAEEPFIAGFGGSEGDPPNTIAYNEGPGVLVEDAASEATIRGNSIFANSELGIKINAGAAAPVPQIESVDTTGSEPVVAWSFLSPPEAETYAFDLYVNESCDPSGSGEGQVFLGTVVLEADGLGGTTIISSELENPPLEAEVFTATMTPLASGSTSQFSACFNEVPSAEIESEPPDPTESETAEFSFSGFDPSGFIAGFECKLDDGGFSACDSPKEYAEIGQGSHTFEVRAIDKAGQAGVPDSYTWLVETATPPDPPVLTSTQPASPANNNSPKVFGMAAAGTAITLYPFASCTGTPLPNVTVAELESGITVSVADDSLTEFSAIAWDGEVESDCSNTISYREDSTLPTVTIEAKPANPTAATEAEFSFSGADPGGSGVKEFQCKLDAGAFAPCTSPQSYTELNDGSHEFAVRSIDNAGNQSSPATYSWSVDTAAPAVTIDSLSKTVIGSGGSSELRFHANKDGTYQLRLGGADCDTGTLLQSGPYGGQPAEATLTIAAAELAEGANPLHLCLTDAVENTGSATTSIRLDTTAPSTSIISRPANPTTATAAEFSFSGEDPGGSGIAGFECKLDAGAFSACTSPATYAQLATGAHGFAVRAVDNAGNVDPEPPAYDWTISTPPPPAAKAAAVAPVNGESVAVTPEEGKVLIKVPGSDKFVPIEEYKTIPVGSIIDATNGKVLLTTIDANGNEQSALFFGGRFEVAQRDGSGLTTLRLVGGDFNTCGGVTRGHALPANPGHGSPCGCPAQSSASASGARKGRKLWGSGHGNFRTEGNHGSATVRGTIWFTEDRCDGTFFKVRRGVVTIRDFDAGKTFSLPAGMSYLAKP